MTPLQRGLMTASVIPRSVGTHDGQFHADEVTACALLVLFDLVDKDKIVRTRDPEKLAQCEFVCDVGGIYDPESKRFDHHQSDYQGEWSSAGMVMDYLRRSSILPEDEYWHLQEMLMKGVDDHDNGRATQVPGVQTFSHIVANFAPVRYGAALEESERAFYPAFEFVLAHLQRLLERYRYVASCREAVRKQMQEHETCLIFDEPVPWLENFFALGGEEHSAIFVIMPSGDSWKLRGIPPNMERRMEVRVPLPEEWAGLLEGELEAVCGIPGALFCHKGRFISVWETKEAALQALQMILARR